MKTSIPSEEIIENDDVLLSVFRDSTSGGIFVRISGPDNKGVVVSAEAVVHAAGVVEQCFDSKSNVGPASRTLN
jgi:hypothetical protein